MASNSDTCTPPAGTKDGTWHWLKYKRGGIRAQYRWFSRGWSINTIHGAISPSRFKGWTYIGPAEETTPPQYEECRAVITGPADVQRPIGTDFNTVWSKDVSKQHISEPPTPPDPRDQEIAELRGLLGEVKDRGVRHSRDCATHDYNPCDCGAISVMVKIRVKLGERK